MVKIVVVFFVLLFTLGCNQQPNVNENKNVEKPTIIGLWEVKFICETDFTMDSRDTLRGTFCHSINNQFIKFNKDSIFYIEDSLITDTYKYSKYNDSVLNVQNIKTGIQMKMYIQNITLSNLKFKNIRIDSNRQEEYEIMIDCIKTKKE
ncbi:MAG TPA: hypothetical protein PLU36_04255 [Chitinophagaceae bacterium]|nr:hypothetical protein [Chitinophagaceae bacterium]HMZ45993.1 hypothetical protein [Chitinophagaceae bacterium]HNM34100.1 hypothetical protein [Chitinophagaceae bacterium]HNN32053.1 hypothetical protein [Chitinophagaceae bacterium]